MFEKHQSEVTWPGPVSDTNLFYVWQEMKGTVRSNPQAEDPDEFHGFEKDDVEEDRMKTTLKWKDTFEIIHNPTMPESSLSMSPETPRPKEMVVERPKDSPSLQEQPVDRNSSESKSLPPDMPRTALSELKQNLFSTAFVLPKITPKAPKGCRKRPRPPAVATSDEYRAWFLKVESDKQKEEQLRAEKKAARDAKKAAVAERRKDKPKAGPKRAKLVI